MSKELSQAQITNILLVEQSHLLAIIATALLNVSGLDDEAKQLMLASIARCQKVSNDFVVKTMPKEMHNGD